MRRAVDPQLAIGNEHLVEIASDRRHSSLQR
jgi:hypothetical protein